MTISDVEIGWRTQLSSEIRPWAIDMTAELDPSDSPSAATATLTDLLTGASFPAGLVDLPTTSVFTPHVTQVVTGLTPGRNYRLVLTVAMGGSKQTATVVYLRCPY